MQEFFAKIGCEKFFFSTKSRNCGSDQIVEFSGIALESWKSSWKVLFPNLVRCYLMTTFFPKCKTIWVPVCSHKQWKRNNLSLLFAWKTYPNLIIPGWRNLYPKYIFLGKTWRYWNVFSPNHWMLDSLIVPRTLLTL